MEALRESRGFAFQEIDENKYGAVMIDPNKKKMRSTNHIEQRTVNCWLRRTPMHALNAQRFQGFDEKPCPIDRHRHR
ncbi:MAG: hypothetical protein KF905_10415 [Flavobacteriales bacterium]|nr:hypothetical protein [Flavobacteriales bacterium]